MKILPHEFKQVKYKILQLDLKKNIFFGFVGEYNKNGSLEWFLIENGLGPFGVKPTSETCY